MSSFMQRKRAELRALGIDPRRLPSGQYRTERFPVLHLGPVPEYPHLADWTLTIGGDGVEAPRSLSWEALRALPTRSLAADIHCVTKWSRFDVTWEGVMLDDLVAACSPRDDAVSLLAWGEHGYSASLSWAEIGRHEAMLAWAVDGAPLEPHHGYPLRLVVPHLYFWKSVKWLRRIELWRDERTGYWEDHGYHHHGDPFLEQRYWGDDAATGGASDHEEFSAASGDGLSRPLRSILDRALASPTGSVAGDIVRLRDACAVVLRRCLDLANAEWPQLMAVAGERGGWDRWRHDGLLAAAAPERDLTAEATRDLLAELADELRSRGGLHPGVWEGDHRQARTESPEWAEGKRRRDLVFSLERIVELIEDDDADGLRALAASVVRRDVDGEYRSLPDALLRAADDVHAGGGLRAVTRDALVACLEVTPFAASVASLPVAADRP